MRIFPFAARFDYSDVIEYMTPPKPDAAALWWMFALILALAALFVLYEVTSRRIRKKRAEEHSERDFSQLSMICQLAPAEIRLLRHLIGVCEIRLPDRLFTSFELFNMCLEKKGPEAAGLTSEADAKRLRLIRNKIFFGERSRIAPIRTTHDLKSNQLLHLKRLETGEVFMAPIVEAGVSGLLVTTPRPGGRYLEFEAGERFDIYFWRDRDASYHFESAVVGQTGAHSLITILEHVEDVERTQRRQFHRVNISVKVNAIPVTRRDLDKISRGEAVDTRGHPGLPAHIVDISGSGFALAARTSLKPSDIVYIEIPIDEGGGSTLPIVGKIMSVSEREHTGEFLMHAEFAGLSADLHEKVFWFIYTHAARQATPPA
jgi:c-di-GMP-binding flagellar brake protein YcgR